MTGSVCVQVEEFPISVEAHPALAAPELLRKNEGIKVSIGDSDKLMQYREVSGGTPS